MYKTSEFQRVGWRVGGVEGASASYTEALDTQIAIKQIWVVVVAANSQMRTFIFEIANGSDKQHLNKVDSVLSYSRMV